MLLQTPASQYSPVMQTLLQVGDVNERARRVTYFVPLMSDSMMLGTRRPAAVVLISDPEDLPRDPGLHLARLYGLTPAEARVALAVAEGSGVEQAARALRIGSATVRTHLQRCFAKTSTHRQAELARLVLSAMGLRGSAV